MSWQNPNSNMNPNSNSYTPGGGYGQNYNQWNQGGYYPPQQQGGGGYGQNYGGGGNYQWQGGQGQYSNPQGGYGNNMGGGGYYDPYNAGAYNPHGFQQQPPPSQQQQQQQQQQQSDNNRRGYNQQKNRNQNTRQPEQQQQYQNQGGAKPVVAPVPPSKVPAPTTANTAAAAPVALPVKKKGGGTLSLGKKKQEEAKAEEAAAESSSSPAPEPKDDSTKASPAASKAASPTIPKPVEKSAVKLTPEELRESVRKEIARQREQSKKQYVRDPRPHFNIVFCGHVDAGKSTISGHLLMEKGIVDQREMDKLRREAEIHHREGWEYAYVMDVSEEERAKGITRETGAAYFETEKRRVTVLDAPGHRAFVPSMIGGATQADICVLVISSRTGEFETGFEKGGQTREHAMLVRTCGVKQMICVVNKMDEMNWSEERYNEIVDKLRPFLRQNGYDEKTNLVFIPVAGLTGENLIKRVEPSHCSWFTGPSMMEVIDELVIPESKTEDDVFCIPLVGGYKDDGKNYIYGKVESGSIAVGEKIQILPTKQEAVVEGISIESTEFEKCYPGDNVHLRVRGIDESDIHSGYVATSVPTSLRAVEFLQARVVILDVKNIISAGSRFMLHIHAAQEEASFHKLLAKIDRKTNEVVEKNPACVKAGDVVIARIELDRSLVVETHKDFDKLGRFMLRDEGKTIAIGVVTKLYESTHESLAKGTA